MVLWERMEALAEVSNLTEMVTGDALNVLHLLLHDDRFGEVLLDALGLYRFCDSVK